MQGGVGPGSQLLPGTRFGISRVTNQPAFTFPLDLNASALPSSYNNEGSYRNQRERAWLGNGEYSCRRPLVWDANELGLQI